MMHNGDDLLFLHRREEKVIQAQKSECLDSKKWEEAALSFFPWPERKNSTRTPTLALVIYQCQKFFSWQKRENGNTVMKASQQRSLCATTGFFCRKGNGLWPRNGKTKSCIWKKGTGQTKNDFRPKETSPFNFIQSPPQWTAEINCFPCRERSSKKWLYTVI